MVKSGDSEEADTAAASSALERAQAAIDKLEKAGDRQSRLGVLSRLTVGGVILLAIGGLLVHTFFEQRVPQIDSTSVSLLAVALIAPFVPKLKALEVGGAKAEWQESAQVGLKEIVAVLRPQQEAIKKLYDDLGSAIASGAQPEVSDMEIGGNLRLVPPAGDAERPPRPLRRLLWFDVFPGSSENELAALRQFLHVTVAASREQAMASISRNEVDAIVINEMRGDPNVFAPPPGVTELKEIIASKRLPVFLYIPDSLAGAHRIPFDVAAVAVVTSFSELVRGLGFMQAAALERFALTVAARNGVVLDSQRTQRVDVVVQLRSGKRVGIEVASWLKKPQMAAFTDRLGRLVEGLARQQFAYGILLTRTDLIDDRMRRRASDDQIEVVSPEELQGVLSRIDPS